MNTIQQDCKCPCHGKHDAQFNWCEHCRESQHREQDWEKEFDKVWYCKKGYKRNKIQDFIRQERQRVREEEKQKLGFHIKRLILREMNLKRRNNGNREQVAIHGAKVKILNLLLTDLKAK